MRSFAPLLLLLPALQVALASPLVGDQGSDICPEQAVIVEYYIGEGKNVTVEEISCPQAIQRRDLESRQTNVCGAQCNTDCFIPSGGGPDPNDCHVIADALRYDSQNTAPLFTIPAGANNTIAMTYLSCKSFFVNQEPNATLEYCRTDWAAVIDWVAPNCQSTQNAHGGLCLANDQSWFIEIAHV